jgi:hypothetical protein
VGGDLTKLRATDGASIDTDINVEGRAGGGSGYLYVDDQGGTWNGTVTAGSIGRLYNYSFDGVTKDIVTDTEGIDLLKVKEGTVSAAVNAATDVSKIELLGGGVVGGTITTGGDLDELRIEGGQFLNSGTIGLDVDGNLGLFRVTDYTGGDANIINTNIDVEGTAGAGSDYLYGDDSGSWVGTVDAGSIGRLYNYGPGGVTGAITTHTGGIDLLKVINGPVSGVVDTTAAGTDGDIGTIELTGDGFSNVGNTGLNVGGDLTKLRATDGASVNTNINVEGEAGGGSGYLYVDAQGGTWNGTVTAGSIGRLYNYSSNGVTGDITTNTGGIDLLKVKNGDISGDLTFDSLSGATISASGSIGDVTVNGAMTESSIIGDTLGSISVSGQISGTGGDDEVHAKKATDSFTISDTDQLETISSSNNNVDFSGLTAHVG